MKMITQYLDYKLPLLVRSAPTPGFSIMTGILEDGECVGIFISHTVDVVSDTFQEIVLNTTHTCFLLIYSPNCPASRNVLPILDRVALRIKDLKNVTIAKMDLTKNDLPIRILLFITTLLPTCFSGAAAILYRLQKAAIFSGHV